ncbi:Rpn family recombination-promoting nuclease/putative transposase [Pistricoccus aurantiacus]|uniref:Rpn family recombination-promoting nuclease/putative transposase n=2 Tax=Pistricoccus aurantiacus TaxID=1883414 RepID=A0A5B8T1A1_9GAMM|nr:Rpn family recombination-promoting nuclease/putative transposase [Pistricoccus aurantiacus]
MNNQHDQSYKLLFSEPRTVRDLLTGFVREAWVKQLDLDSLEKVSSTFVTDDLRDREDDVIWRVRFGDEWLYVYLLIEFQSTVDAFMALRIMTYVGLLYQDLVKQKKLTQSGKLPPVLPIVLYNGGKRWNAARNVSELVQPVPGGLEQYRPDLPYLLLDEGAIVASEQWPKETRNVVSAIFRLEYHRSHQDAIELIGLLVQWLQAPEQTRLRRHFALWIKRVLLPSWVPDDEEAEWQALNDLNEVHNMLAERAKQWPEHWKQEGRQEGEEKARLETARNLIRDTSLTDEAIASATGLDVEQVTELRTELRH